MERIESGTSWLLRRWLPSVLLGALTGAFFGWVRFRGSAWMGLAGMLAGAAAGYASGRLGKGDGGTFWGFGQRATLALGAALAYGAAQLLTAGSLHATPADTLLTWVGEVADGGLRERFFSMGQTGGTVLHLYRGTLTGGWWILFVLLDLVLFGFLFLVSCSMGLSRKELAAPGPSRCALGASLALGLLLAAGSAGAWHFLEGPYPSRFSPEEWRELEPYAGTYRLVERDGQALPREKQPLLRFRVAAFDSLEGRMGRNTLDATRRRTHFSGFLRRSENPGALPLTFRLTFSPDASTLFLKVITFGPDGRKNLLFRGERMVPKPSSTPAGTP